MGNKKKGIKLEEYSISFIILSLIFTILLFGRPTITGYVTGVGESYSDGLDLVINESSSYDWVLEHPGELRSIRLDGSISEGGSAKVYLEYNNESYLVFDSLRLGEEGLMEITGLVVSDLGGNGSSESIDESEPSNENKSIITKVQGGGSKSIKDVFEFEVSGEFNWNVSYDKLCTKWDVNSELAACYGNEECCALLLDMGSSGLWNDSFYLSYGRYNSSLENVVSAQLIYYDVDLSVPYSDIVLSDSSEVMAEFHEPRIDFSDICIDTCLLPEFNESSYKLIINVSNGTLRLDKISYSVVEVANITLIEVKDQQLKAEINKPVKWIKKSKNKTISIPDYAFNISVNKIINDKKIRLDKNKIRIKDEANKTNVEVDETADSYEVIYETEAPISKERNISLKKKRITISAPDELNYTNILAYTQLPQEVSEQKIRLYRTTEGIKELTEIVNYTDTNDNGLIDYVEWIVPHLSNQTYELEIVIIDAEHLNKTREFVVNIFAEVNATDDITYTIPKNQYVRAYFERNLIDGNVIDIYTHNTEPATIYVYEKDSDIIIGHIEDITTGIYFIHLNFSGSQDVFDLKSQDADIIYDYIHDGIVVACDDSVIQPGNIYCLVTGLSSTKEYELDWYNNGATCGTHLDWAATKDCGTGVTECDDTQASDQFTAGSPGACVAIYQSAGGGSGSNKGSDTVIISGPADTTPPTYNLSNNASTLTKINGVVNWSINLSDTGDGLSFYIFAHNQSGTLRNVSNGTLGGVASTSVNYTLTINKTRGNYICGQFWVNDSAANGGNVNQTLLTESGACFTVVNSVPITPDVTYPADGKNYSDIPYINFSSTDADGDTITYDVYINGSLNISTTTNVTDWNASGGYYNLTVTARDSSASSANSSVRHFRLDTTVPSWSGNETNATLVKINGNVTFNITVSDNGAGLSYYIFSWNGTGEGWLNDTNGSISGSSVKLVINKSTNLSQGNTIGYRWYANDSVRNWNMSLLRVFTVVNTAPITPTVTSPYNTEINNTRKIDFYSIDADGDAISYTIYINYTLNITTSINITTWDASDGYYNLTVTANDSSDVSANSTVVWFTLDTTAPTVNIIYPTNDSNISSNSIDLNGSATDARASSLTHYYVINGTTNTTSTDSNSTFNASDGYYNFTLFISDGLQNGSDTIYFRLDATEPSFSNNQTNASSITYNGTYVQLNLTITDYGVGIDFYRLTINDTSDNTWINGTIVDTGGSSVTAIFNYSIHNFTTNGGTLGWRVWANDTLGQVNISQIYTLVVQASSDETPPTYSNFTNNASGATGVNSVVNWSINLADIGGVLSFYIFAHNDSGTLLNVSNGTLSGASAFVNKTVAITSSKGNYICGQFWVNDSGENGGNVNQTLLTESGACFTVANSAPTTPDVIYPSDGKNYSDTELDINFTSTDADGDTITYEVYINGSLNISTTTNVTDWNASDGYYNLTVTARDSSNSSDNNSVRHFRLDTTAPSWSGNETNATLVKINGNVTFNITISDGGSGLSYYIFSWNGTGSWDNLTNGTVSGSSQKLIINKSTSLSQGNTIGYRWYANDSAGNWNTSLLRVFAVVNSEITFSDAVNSSPNFKRYENFTANITITDADGELNYSIFSTNNTGSWANDTTIISGTTYSANSSKNISLAQGNYICWKYYANDSANSLQTSSEYCFTVQNTAPTLSISSPVDNDNNNVNLTVGYIPNDVDSDSLTCYLYINNSINETDSSITLGSSNTITSVNMSADGHYGWYINCTDATDYINLTARTYILDTINPILTVGSPLNESYHNSNFYINVSATDSNLYMLNYTFYNSSNGSIQSNQTTTSSATYLDLNDTVNISSLADGTYYINFSVSDSHTKKQIKDYKVKKGTTYLEYETEEGITIKIETLEGLSEIDSFSTTKLIDRYKWNFRFKNNKQTVVFRLTSSNKLDYIVDSKYSAHFVTLNGKKGNWIDFNMLGLNKNNYQVIRVNDYIYDVTIKDVDKDEFEFDSIGGLNIVERYYEIYIDRVPPTYSNFANNGSGTKINGIVNWSIDLADTALSGYMFAHNDSGTLRNVSNGTLSGASAFVNGTVTITKAQGNYICGQFWVNDSAGNINQTLLIDSNACFTVANSEITFSDAVNSSPNFKRYENFTANITITDADSELNYSIFSTNNSGSWANDTTIISGTTYRANSSRNISLAQGNYICWKYYANDSANSIQTSSEYCFTVQNTAPITPTAYYPADGKNYTNIPYINYSSTDADGDTITYDIYINGSLNISTTTNVTDWNASDGYYNLTVTARDSSDSSANSSVRHFRLDTTEPSWSGNETNATLVKIDWGAQFNITVLDNGAGLSYYIFSWNGTGEGWLNDTNGSISGSSVKLVINKSTNLSQGNTIGYRWYANDSLNQWNMSLLRVFTVVNSVPATPDVTYPADGKNYTNIPYINYSSTDADGDTITYDIYINGSLNISTTTNVTDWNASDGFYNLTVTARDSSASSANSSVRHFRLDIVEPSFSDNKTNASSTVYDGGTVQLNLTITDNVGLDFYRLITNDSTGFSWTNESLNDTEGTSVNAVFNYSIEKFPAAGGILGWRVWANDSAGNANISQIYTLTVYKIPDSTKPGFSNNQTNETVTIPTVNGVIQLNLTVTDNIEVYTIRLATNDSGTMRNESGYEMIASGTSATAIFNFTVSAAKNSVIKWQVWANDTSGNANVSLIRTFTVKNSAPTTPDVTYPADGKNYIDIPYINFSSADPDGDAVSYTIYINGSLNITTTVNVTDWNASDGYYNLTITANDSSAVSANSSVRYFRLDTTKPSWSGNETNATLVKINGNVTFNITISDGGSGLSYYIFSWNGTGSWDNNSNGSVSGGSQKLIINKSTNLSQGNTIGYRWYANDSAGNWNTSLLRMFMVVNSEITFSDAVNSSPNFKRYENFTANITITDADSELNYSIFSTNNSGSWANDTTIISGTTYRANSSRNISLAQGNYICWKYYANDSANSIQTSSEYCFTVQNTAPITPTAYYPADGKNYTNIPYINYSSTDADGDTITYDIYINGSLNISTTTNVTDWNASDGYYNLTVTARDSSDSSTNSSVRYFRLDTTEPSWSGNETNATLVNINGGAQFNITVSDSGPGLSYYIFSWNGTGEGWLNDTNGSISGNSIKLIANKSTNLSYGNTIGYRWYANDSLNQWNMSLLRVFTVANSAPTQPQLYYPVDGKNYSDILYINYSSTDADGDSLTYTLYINNTINVTGTSVNVTQWNASDGFYNWTVTANDGSASSSNSSVRHFRLDTTAPVISNLRNTSTTNQSSFIEFGCNELCNYSILWYNSTDLIGSIYNNTFATNHNPYLTNLSNVTTYFTNLTVWDGVGNSVTNKTFNFTTAKTIVEDVILPTYSNFQNNASTGTKRNGIVNWSITLQDETGLSYYFFAHNQSGTLTNVSNGTLSGGTSAFVNYTLRITRRRDKRIYGQYWFNDTSGNINQTLLTDSGASFTVQNTAPITPTVYYPSDGKNYSDTELDINFSSTDVDGDTITYDIYINGSLNISTTTNVTDWNASDGFYNLTVTARDSSSSSANSSVRHFRLDTIAPSVSLILPKNNTADNGSSILFSYNVTDANNVTNCSLILNSKVNLTNSSITKDITLNFTVNNLTVRGYNWSVNCTDIVSNVGETETRILGIIILTEFLGNTTNISSVNVSDIPNLVIDQPVYGKINFSESIDLSGGGNIDSYVNISFNRIEINSTALPALNKSATLYLYNLTFTEPRILRDDVVCPSSICAEISYSNRTLAFNVTQFTVYSAEEASEEGGDDVVSVGGGGGGAPTGIECRDDSYCKKNEKCINKKCVKLFDVEILKVDSPIEPGQYLDFSYLMKGMADIEGDVIVKFWIEKDNKIILSGQDTIYLGKFEEKRKEANLYIYKDMLGKYDFFVELNFENYSVVSHRPIEVVLDVLVAKESVELEKIPDIKEPKPSFWQTIGRAFGDLEIKTGKWALAIIITLIVIGLLTYFVVGKKTEISELS